MVKALAFLFSCLLLFSMNMAATPSEAINLQNEWNKKFTTPHEFTHFYELLSTSDGYIMVGSKYDYPENARVIVVKTDKEGNLMWDKTIDGRAYNWGEDIIPADNGFIIGGYSENGEIFAVKIDENGEMIWNRVYRLKGSSFMMDMCEADDGYLLAGITSTKDHRDQAFIMKIDEDGNEIWNRTYGGKYEEMLENIIKVEDGYIFAGWTNSYGNGVWDVWLVKVDENGNEIWNRTYGGRDIDDARCVALTSDGGYIIAGATMSYGNGWDDVYIIKVDEEGKIEWEKTFGGEDFESAEAIVETNDGYIIAGATASFDVGMFDGLLLKIDKNGNLIWYKTFGGRGREVFYDVLEDNGYYIIAGLTTISYDPYKEVAWLIKCSDSYPAELNIEKPKNYIYLFDREIFPAKRIIIFGDITVKAEVNDAGNYVDRVEFYLCHIGHLYEYEPREIVYSPPYEWKWDEEVRGKYAITVAAYYGSAGAVAVDEVEVYIINTASSKIA